MGIKKQKSSLRFPKRVKTYLTDKFLIGEEMGNKVSPTIVSRDMRRERNEKGDRLFVGADCLSSQQIAAYFSRLAATRKKHGHLATSIVSWEEVEEFFNEEQIGVEEEDITYKKNAVFSSLQLKHPVTYKSYNLCKLFADGKLATKFSIAELKAICDS